jgi:hypothetical protein
MVEAGHFCPAKKVVDKNVRPPNNVCALEHEMAHYTLIPNENGGAIDLRPKVAAGSAGTEAQPWPEPISPRLYNPRTWFPDVTFVLISLTLS